VVFWFSSPAWSAARTAGFLLPLLAALLPWALPEQLDALHWLIRKTSHVAEYAVLAGLWRWALGGGWRASLGLSVATALLDELHQAVTPAREGSIGDVALDTLGAGAALVVLGGGLRAAVERLTGALLWVAAVGGTLLLAVHWAAAAPAGWLLWSTPAAWLALLFLWWRGRHRS
jgi:VanZ family protein